MVCKRCGDSLTGSRRKFCSPRCCKLFHKVIYRKKHRDQINVYRRAYNKKGIRISGKTWERLRSKHLKNNPACEKCGTTEDLQTCHIKPRHKGGRHKGNLITFCRTHHHEFDEILREFWN